MIRTGLARISKWLVGMSPGTFALFAYGLALAPRLIFVLVAGRANLSLDEIEYHILAKNLAAGHGYVLYFGLPSTFRPPGYPFFLAGLYYLFGPSYYAARIVQSFIAASEAVLTYAVGRRVFGETVGRLGSLFVALYVPLILYSVGLLTENLVMPLVLLSLWCLLRLRETGSWRYSALGGVALAASILVRPELTALLPFLFVWLLWPLREWKRAIGQVGVMTAIVVAVVTPWSVRNSLLTGQLVYLDTRAGYNLYIGYREGATGSFDMRAAQNLVGAMIRRNLAKLSESGVHMTEAQVWRLWNEEVMSYKQPPTTGETLAQRYHLTAADGDITMDNWGRAQALAFVREHPWKALALLPVKFAYFWGLEDRLFLFAYSYDFVGYLPPVALALCLFVLLSPFVILTLFAVVGTLFAEWRDKGLALILLPILFYTALHTATIGDARFHFVVIPLLALLAANGMALVPAIRTRWRSGDAAARRWVRRRAVGFVVLAGMFAVIWGFGLWVSWDNLRTVFGPGGNVSHLTF